MTDDLASTTGNRNRLVAPVTSALRAGLIELNARYGKAHG